MENKEDYQNKGSDDQKKVNSDQKKGNDEQKKGNDDQKKGNTEQSKGGVEQSKGGDEQSKGGDEQSKGADQSKGSNEKKGGNNNPKKGGNNNNNPKKGGNQKGNPQQKKGKPQAQQKDPNAVQVVVNLADYPIPPFAEHRIKVWVEIKKQNEQEKKTLPIKVTLPDGKTIDAISNQTTPLDIANGISKALAQQAVVAKVNGELWDLFRPFEADSTLELLKFDNPQAKDVFWHSSAHVMGQALERRFKCLLCIGPPLENGGFYYDVSTNEKEGKIETVDPSDYPIIEKLVENIVEEKQPFERMTLTKEQALDMFKYNKYKQEIIRDKVPDGSSCTAYRCGPLVDLCKGPHVVDTSRIKAFGVWKNNSAYWKGKAENDSLQRVYGMSFPNDKQFKEWKDELERAKERDHRLQGKNQELYFFHPLSPGCVFFLPRGAKLYNSLMNFVRSEYRKRGFTEVVTPNIFNKDLWVTSGHWAFYKDDMFTFQVEKQEFALKPMNCPGHCLMFQHMKCSYKDLPIRLADFGVLHRNELSGTLTGLTRVRRFCQDDAHIFCRPDQISQEIRGCFDFLKHVYTVFGFEFTLELSTRPESKSIGSVEIWNSAEDQLREELNKFVGEGGWKLNPGDGAFYGPKIDIHVFDTFKREHQCATIQLDFNLPSKDNFDLTYVKEDGSEGRCVMIHRAIFGSLERFMAILVENTAGKWPYWISPRQMIVLPISSKYVDYGRKVVKELFDAGFDPEIDGSDRTFKYKVFDAEKGHYNFLMVVGQKEEESHTVNLRSGHDNVVHGEISITDLISKFKQLHAEYK